MRGVCLGKTNRCPEPICSLNSRYERNIGEHSTMQAEPTNGSGLTGGFHSLGLHREAWSALARPHRQNTQKTRIKLDADASRRMSNERRTRDYVHCFSFFSVGFAQSRTSPLGLVGIEDCPSARTSHLGSGDSSQQTRYKLIHAKQRERYC
jgi:hypothetical protein